MKRPQLFEQLRAQERKSSRASPWDVVETRLRLPRKLVYELKKVAAAEGLSMNALVAGFIDAALIERGRKSVDDLAPWFADYLVRNSRAEQGKTDGKPTTPDPDFT